MKCMSMVAIAVLVSAGVGAVEVSPYLKLTGTGSDDTKWSSAYWALPAGVPHVFSCEIRHPSGSDDGVAVMIPAGTSIYRRFKGHDWQSVTNAFVVAGGRKCVSCALRQWHVPGDSEFRNVRIAPAVALHRRIGDVELGFGESMDGNTYRFGTRFSGATHLHSRALRGFRGLDCDSTLSFRKGSMLSFVHELGGRTFRSATASVACMGATAGSVTLSVSADGESWTDFASVSNIGIHRVEIPAAILPAKRLFLRLAGSADAAVSVRQYAFDAQVEGSAVFGFGATDYMDSENGRILMTAAPWDYLSDATSGGLLPGGTDGVSFWCQSSGRKIFRGRPLPQSEAKALRLATARNEEEAVQFVIRPQTELRNVRVAATLPSDLEVEVRRVGYVLVDLPMDSMGARGMWPDPLFAQDADGCAIAAGENQPFWVTVRPKKDAPAGIRRGEIRVSAVRKGKPVSWRVPFEVRVFGFMLPDTMTCETSFGLTFKTVYDYHHAKTDAEKGRIADLYYRHFARHHISPYHPTAGILEGSWTDKWSKPDNPADSIPTFDWSAWDAAIEKALNVYHFNTFVFPIKGKGNMDGISRGKRGVRRINGVQDDNPLYETYMERYLKAVEGHLKEKGWLNTAYVYSFDEPRREDYAYMIDDLSRMRKYAPGLRRMVTVEPKTEADRRDLEGHVSLWCPITEHFDRNHVRARQAAGDQVWWYITFSSEAPKVNEHIEHSGVDMRVWLWQTWLEGVTGVLIWETAYWNCKSVYPDPQRPQNPYEDSICWGGKKPWNTGEGKYIYPPRKCFSTPDAVIDGPVDSIRFEMLREGVEDYEYFAMLKRLDPGNPLLAVPRDVTTSLDDYAKDPAGMERHRLRLARELERLSAGKGK